MEIDKLVLNGDEYDFAGSSGIGGQPTPITLASQMVDHDVLYLYLGNESGYDYGYIYAYLNGAWTKTSLYGKGDDGYSPSVTLEEVATGVKISVTNESGTSIATVENGTATDAQVDAWLDEHPEATTTVQDGSVTPEKTNFWDISLLEGHYESTGYTRGTLNFSTGAVTPNESASTAYTDLLPLTEDCFTTNFVVLSAKGSAASGTILNRWIALYKDGTFVQYLAMSDLFISSTIGQALKTSLTAQGTISDFNQFRAQVTYGNKLYYSGDTTIGQSNISNLTIRTYTMNQDVKELFQDGLEINTPGSVTNETLADGAVTNEKIADETIEPRKLYPYEANNLLVQSKGVDDYHLGGSGQDLWQTGGWISDYIPVSPGEVYTLNYVPSAFRLYAFYNSNKTVVGTAYSVSAQDTNYDITVPSGVAYVRVSVDDKRNCIDYNTIFKWKLTLKENADLPSEYSFPWLKLTDENRIRSSLFRDKIVLGTGDSITENNSRNNNKSWLMYLPEKLGVKVYNDGKSGTGLCKRYSGNHSILYRVENLWATDYAGITPDIILIMANMNDGTGTGDGSTQGLNDLGISGWASTGYLAVGTPSDDINTQSVYGCAKRFLEDVITMYPLAQIGWILSTPRMGTTPYWTGKENQYGHGWFEDYITAIKYQCEQYNVPVLDLYHESGFRPTNTTNMNTYMDDGTTHPNTAGTKKYMVDPIVKWIKEKFGEIS